MCVDIGACYGGLVGYFLWWFWCFWVEVFCGFMVFYGGDLVWVRVLVSGFDDSLSLMIAISLCCSCWMHSG